LNQHKEVKELIFSLDNDLVGREAATKLANIYREKDFRTRIELPRAKDFNIDLINLTIVSGDNA